MLLIQELASHMYAACWSRKHSPGSHFGWWGQIKVTSSIVSNQSFLVLFLDQLRDHVTCKPKQRGTERLEFAVKIFSAPCFLTWISSFSNVSYHFPIKGNSKHGSYLSWSPWRNYAVFLCELRHCIDESIGINIYGTYANMIINRGVVPILR